jgi:hypothetical protein
MYFDQNWWSQGVLSNFDPASQFFVEYRCKIWQLALIFRLLFCTVLSLSRVWTFLNA